MGWKLVFAVGACASAFFCGCSLRSLLASAATKESLNWVEIAGRIWCGLTSIGLFVVALLNV